MAKIPYREPPTKKPVKYIPDSYSNPELRKLNNYNHAVNDTAELLIPGLDNVKYFVQTFQIPSLSIPAVETTYKGEYTSVPGDHIIYGEFTADFLVDEDLSNWEALVDYIKRVAFKDDVINRYVDISIDWKTRNLNSHKIITLHKAYITDLSGFTIVTNGNDQDILLSTVSFRYQYLTIEKANNPKGEFV